LTPKLCVVGVVLLTSCGGSSASSGTVALKQKITISSTTDPTSEMFAEIYGQALEKAEFRVIRRTAFPTNGELFTAVANGDVELTAVPMQQLYDFAQTNGGAGEALPKTTTEQAAIITKYLPQGLKMGSPSNAEDKDVVFCAKTFTDTNSIVTLTDLATKGAANATLAAPDGFDSSVPLGAATLHDTYQMTFKSIVPTANDKIVAAVTGGTADCGVGRSADPALAVATLSVVLDDKAVVPNNVVLPLLGGLGASDDVLSIVDATSAQLTTTELRTLMQRLKVDGASPEVVANEFTGNAGQ